MCQQLGDWVDCTTVRTVMPMHEVHYRTLRFVADPGLDRMTASACSFMVALSLRQLRS